MEEVVNLLKSGIAGVGIAPSLPFAQGLSDPGAFIKSPGTQYINQDQAQNFLDNWSSVYYDVKQKPCQHRKNISTWRSSWAQGYASRLINTFGNPVLSTTHNAAWNNIPGFKAVEVKDQDGAVIVAVDGNLTGQQVGDLTYAIPGFMYDNINNLVMVTNNSLKRNAITIGLIQDSIISHSKLTPEVYELRHKHGLAPSWYTNYMNE